QQRVIVPLHDDQLVRRQVLVRDIPGLARPTDADALALPDRVEGEADVLADRAALVVDDRPRRLGQVAVEELAERPLADEANAGRVLLRVVRQPRFQRDAAYFALPEL